MANTFGQRPTQQVRGNPHTKAPLQTGSWLSTVFVSKLQRSVLVSRRTVCNEALVTLHKFLHRRIRAELALRQNR